MWDDWAESRFTKVVIEAVLHKVFERCNKEFYPDLVSVYPLRANEFRLEPWRAGLDIQPFDFIMIQTNERSYEVHVLHTMSRIIVTGSCEALGLTEELTIQDDTLDLSDELKGWKFVINI
jgi:hypothetical protein